MKIERVALACVLGILMAFPAAAQTMQTTPGRSSSPSITTTPGPATTAPAPRGPEAPTTTRAPAPASSSALVDINSASSTDLDALPGVGKARAAAIIKNRPYKGKDDLLSRHIIPPNVYKGIADKIIARQG
jgi:competence protein ComEA